MCPIVPNGNDFSIIREKGGGCDKYLYAYSEDDRFKKFIESLRGQDNETKVLRIAGLNLNHFDIMPSVTHSLGSKDL